jgi:hypothetical protein
MGNPRRKMSVTEKSPPRLIIGPPAVHHQGKSARGVAGLVAGQHTVGADRGTEVARPVTTLCRPACADELS